MFDTGGRAVGLIGTYPHGIDIWSVAFDDDNYSFPGTSLMVYL